MAKRKSSSVGFLTREAMSYETIGPSGKVYEFNNKTPVYVEDKLDIQSFMANKKLKPEFDDEVQKPSATVPVKKKTKSMKIKGLMTDTQLDNFYAREI